ncbi:tRNA (adenosine(37)-N6)-threonylcarbamoyltransferase complex transferase subunit TsaD [Candidatus Microgenomates bacterium]|nr:tRNA (adenosine(37)-N6)-threonylcarbamoyltransferase complex transferase subunit TsaD [Candidatus Microgenomates bacterium]
MIILGIESSCDETACAIVKDGREILSSVVSSSKDLHTKTGGIIPEIAAREQVKCMIPVINLTMKPACAGRQCSNVTMNHIDAIAVTVGPGLIGSLLVGVETAKTIAYLTGKPLIPVNHVFAHLYANWLNVEQPPSFPAIALVVSGGHTELFLMKNHREIKWLGGTRDDAAGETFDKTARLLGLGYPGGPAIAAEAAKHITYNIKHITKNQIKLPRPMMHEETFDFSFSGLKTATLREVNKLKTISQFNNLTITQLSFEIQEAITDVLVDKTLKAAEKYKVKSILLGGGVAANLRLKEKIQFIIHNSKFIIPAFIPPPSLCTDNASYIASFAYFHNHPIPWQEIQARPDLEVEVG